jgi:hypothetical protein
MNEPTVDELVQIFGEKYRKLITDAITYLDEKEPIWATEQTFSREDYVRDLIKRIG